MFTCTLISSAYTHHATEPKGRDQQTPSLTKPTRAPTPQNSAVACTELPDDSIEPHGRPSRYRTSRTLGCPPTIHRCRHCLGECALHAVVLRLVMSQSHRSRERDWCRRRGQAPSPRSQKWPRKKRFAGIEPATNSNGAWALPPRTARRPPNHKGLFCCAPLSLSLNGADLLSHSAETAKSNGTHSGFLLQTGAWLVSTEA